MTWLSSQQFPRLNPEVVCVGFMMNRVKQGRCILRGIRFYSANHHSTNVPYLSIITCRYIGFDSRQCKIFLFSAASRPTLGPTQPLSHGIKWQGCEADHSPPFSVEIKEDGAVPPLPPMSSWHSAQQIKHKDIFTFTMDRHNRSIWGQSTEELNLTPLLNCFNRLDVLHWLVANMKPEWYICLKYIWGYVILVFEQPTSRKESPSVFNEISVLSFWFTSFVENRL
jgi:hypothetical protein